MNPHDDKLSGLLKQWREIEPSARFEADVRRRIRLAEAEEPEHISVIDLLFGHRVWQSALTVAAVLVVGVLVGSSLGVVTARRSVPAVSGELEFMSAGTLAGGYVQLAAEKPRGAR